MRMRLLLVLILAGCAAPFLEAAALTGMAAGWCVGMYAGSAILAEGSAGRDFGGGSTASAGFSVRGSYMQDSESGLVPGTRQKAERGKLLSWNHTSCRHLPVGHFDGKHFKSGSVADISWDVVRKEREKGTTYSAVKKEFREIWYLEKLQKFVKMLFDFVEKSDYNR